MPPARWSGVDGRPLCLAGPRVAESEEQLAATARRLQGVAVDYLATAFPRSGGLDCDALHRVARAHGLRVAVAVASAGETAAALAAGVDVLWIDGVAAQSPAASRDIVAALRGAARPLLVGEPDGREPQRWIAAIDRLHDAGGGAVAALYTGLPSPARDPAMASWQAVIELRRHRPELPVVVHASAVAGERARLRDAAQDALDLGAAGLWIDIHGDPDHAWSAPERHVTPERLGGVLADLTARRADDDERGYVAALTALRDDIDALDRQLLDLLAARDGLVDRIAALKRDANVAPLQVERWRAMLRDRLAWAAQRALDGDSVRTVFTALHAEALRRQAERLRGRAPGDAPPDAE